MKTKVMIVGAGPYGISLAYELWSNNIDFVIAGKPFDLWLSHTLKDTAIRSDWNASEIFTKDNRFNLNNFIERHSPSHASKIKEKRLPNDLFRAYLTDVLKNIPFPFYEQKLVHLEQAENRFICEMEDGRQIVAENVVLATGTGVHQYLPESIKSVSSANIHHSWDVETYESLANKKVLVLGRGQSAAECVQHSLETNNVTWVMRKPPVFYSEPINLPVPVFKLALHLSPCFYFMPKKLKGALGGKFVETTITPDMKHLFHSGKVKIYSNMDGDSLNIEKHSNQLYSPAINEYFDHVICATGFRYHIRNLTFLSESIHQKLQSDKIALHVNYNFETKVSGLYVIGGMVEPVYGPAQRFLMGMRHSTVRLGTVFSHVQ